MARASIDKKPTHLDAFLAHLLPTAKHDLSTSYSEALTIDALLDLASAEQLRTWRDLDLGYGNPDGSETLRSRVAELYKTGASSDIVCATGAHDAAASVIDAILSPGDHAIIILPLYQPLERLVANRSEVSGVALDPKTLCLDLNRVEAAITPRTRLILMNFPNSPSGAILDDDTLEGLVRLCRRWGIWLVNDEVYSHLVVQTNVNPISDLYERGISVDALTKGYGLPGLRLGWVVCRNDEMLRQISQVKAMRGSYLSAPSDALGSIALANRLHLLVRARMLCIANRGRLRNILKCFPSLFDLQLGHNFLFACPGYRGADGPAAFAEKLLSQTGTLVLPTSLWRSPLAATSEDRIRIGLGLRGAVRGLDALADFLDGHRRAIA